MLLESIAIEQRLPTLPPDSMVPQLQLPPVLLQYSRSSPKES